jgi:hypothetical protein
MPLSQAIPMDFKNFTKRSIRESRSKCTKRKNVIKRESYETVDMNAFEGLKKSKIK